MSAASKAPAKVGARRARSFSHPVFVSDARSLARPGLHLLFSRGEEHTRRIMAALKRAGYEAAHYSLDSSASPAVLLTQGSMKIYYVPVWVNVIMSYYPVTTRNLTRGAWARLRESRAHILTVRRASRMECARLVETLLQGGPWR